MATVLSFLGGCLLGYFVGYGIAIFREELNAERRRRGFMREE